MPLLDKYKLWAVGLERTMIVGRFSMAAGGATVQAGEGYTVVRDDTGKYTITFSPTGTKLLSFVAFPAKATFTEPATVVADQTTQSKVHVTVQMKSSAGDALFYADDDDGSEIHFIAIIGDSDVS